MVRWLRPFVVSGFEKSNRSRPNTFSEAGTCSSEAMQTGSRRAPDEGCSTHVRPMSRVVQTARPVRRLSLMLSISTPGAASATCDSVVLVRA